MNKDNKKCTICGKPNKVEEDMKWILGIVPVSTSWYGLVYIRHTLIVLLTREGWDLTLCTACNSHKANYEKP